MRYDDLQEPEGYQLEAAIDGGYFLPQYIINRAICSRAKTRRESRFSYRLKKWFLSLRWVNNWLWRRANKKLDLRGAYKYEIHRDYGFPWRGEWHASSLTTCGDGSYRVGYQTLCPPSTFSLPDYPSIRRLG
jgi:hypothetical protein